MSNSNLYSYSRSALAQAVSKGTTLGVVKGFSFDTLLLLDVSRNPVGVEDLVAVGGVVGAVGAIGVAGAIGL